MWAAISIFFAVFVVVLVYSIAKIGGECSRIEESFREFKDSEEVS